MTKILRWILPAAALLYGTLIYETSFMIHGERYFTLIDDAMISMRYASHLSLGYGLVWNIGEAPVEGFTNLGWSLYMAFLHLFPFAVSKISLAVMITSAFVLLVNIHVVYRIARALLPESDFAPALAAIVTAFYFPLVFWSLRGMELGLLTLLVNCGLLLAVSKDKPFLSGLILAFAILVRIDAVVSAGLIAVYLIAKRRSPASFVPLAFVGLTVVGILTFQRLYFGDFLPTTYYQKIAGYSAWERIRNGIMVFSEFATRDTLMLFLLSLAGVVYYRKRDLETILLLALFLGQCAYSIYVGGDYAEPETNAANRFITQGMPSLFILFSLMTSRFLADLRAARPESARSTPRLNPAIPLALVILIIISGEPWFKYWISSPPLLTEDIRRVKVGLHIAENTAPDAVIAVHAAGQIPYYSQRTTIDLLGLNDPRVARGPGHGEFYPGHNKWDYEYSIGILKPDVIADRFNQFRDYIVTNPDYEEVPNGLFVRKDTTLVDVKGLGEEYR